MCYRDHLNEGECQTPSVHNQALPSLFRLWGKEKSDGRVTSSVNSTFSSTALRSPAPLKSLKPTTQQTTLTHKRLRQTLLHWISYKKLSWLILWYRCNFCWGKIHSGHVTQNWCDLYWFFLQIAQILPLATFKTFIIWSLWITGIKNVATWLFYLGKEALKEIIFNITLFVYEKLQSSVFLHERSLRSTEEFIYLSCKQHSGSALTQKST